jgi:uncharacterized protein YdhG (YjbR/CyaY superfamily)
VYQPVASTWLAGVGCADRAVCSGNRRFVGVCDAAVHIAVRIDGRLAWVSAGDIDNYLAGVDEPKRSTLEQLRRSIHAVVPDAEECISYGMPAFTVQGKTVAGFAAFKNHLSYLPHSGSVLPSLASDLAKYEGTKGSMHFPIDEPLPTAIVNKLLGARLRELGL